MLGFVENIGHKYDFQGVRWSLVGGGDKDWSRCQVFSPNCQKITWGHHGGV